MGAISTIVLMMHTKTKHDVTHKHGGKKNTKESNTKGKTVNMNNKNNLGGQIWGTKFNIIA